MQGFGVYFSQGFYYREETPWPKSKLGRKGFIRLTFPHWRKSRQALKEEWNLEAGVDAETMEGCSACFLIKLRTTSPRDGSIHEPSSIDH